MGGLLILDFIIMGGLLIFVLIFVIIMGGLLIFARSSTLAVVNFNGRKI